MAHRNSLIVSTAVLALAGVAAVLLPSDPVPPTRSPDFSARFQPTLDAEAHIGSFRNLPPVDLDAAPAARRPAPAPRHTAQEHRHDPRAVHR
ncbi:hypothetical protein [Variovorax saccharolyticus]|uniref:hypothetical protein n=1 Tax=Variovorax saccharolyticus TaxID=3053516 RepID=UPI002574E91F|nr:hypothetical protein [Variovorax sp. J31P216]MDM0030386.1 hypothetical protein [Variovorax sp. J31P216]